MSRFLLAGGALLFLLTVPLHATDVYVDVVNGNDLSHGTTPATAWKTLTHAGQFAPPGNGTTIHVAPGIYSSASGEIMPLMFQGQVLVGEQGAASTLIDGGGALAVIRLNISVAGPTTTLASVRGFNLENATTGIEIGCSWSQITTTISDCRIANVGVAGIRAFSGSAVDTGRIALTLERVVIESVPVGLDLSTSTALTATITDCTIRGCTNLGIKLRSYGYLAPSMTRCRIENNTTAGVDADASNYGGLHATFDDCLLAHNGKGFEAPGSGGQGVVLAEFRRCTIADNTGAGVRVLDGLGTLGQASFNSTVLHGNNPDHNVSVLVSYTYSQSNGLDPQFVDRLNGDYRLRFGSSCIDQGDPATQAGTPDLAGVARPIDGNLNTNERVDVGAFEHTPLRLVTSGHIGTPLRLEMSGQAGGTTTVYFTRGAPVAPASTPFGQFDLNPATFGTLLVSPVAPFPPIAFQRPIPNNPLLIGRTFAFQGLTSSSVAPQGFAYTNVVSVTIVP